MYPIFTNRYSSTDYVPTYLRSRKYADHGPEQWIYGMLVLVWRVERNYYLAWDDYDNIYNIIIIFNAVKGI